MRSLLLVLLLAAAGCVSSRTDTTAISCPAERAIYQIRGEPDARLRIIRTPHALNAYSDLAIRVDFEGDTYWFAFVSSLGYSRDYVGRTVDPFEAAAQEDQGLDPDQRYTAPDYDGSEIAFFDANFDTIESAPPQAGDPAPAHLLATGISSSIWYSVPRRVLPKALWDLTACAADDGPAHPH